ncbi:MAG: hypothetical protein MK095_10715, partial [Phycisphaerales bacterium]|nr:hypothetical protein [Phycisphaerales bacterium]
MNMHRQNSNSSEQPRIRISKNELQSGAGIGKLLFITTAGLLCVGLIAYGLLQLTFISAEQRNTERLNAVVGSLDDVEALRNGAVTILAGRNGDSSQQGSGCVMNLTDTHATVATNWHVIAPPSQRNCSNWHISVLFLDERVGTVTGMLLPSTKA